VNAVKWYKGNIPYYVIGTHYQDDIAIIEHELSHAFWHLDELYRRKAIELVTDLPANFFIKMTNTLKEMGYCDEVMKDEITAYLSTDNLYDIVDMLETNKIPWEHMLKFQQHFYEYKKTKEDEQE